MESPTPRSVVENSIQKERQDSASRLNQNCYRTFLSEANPPSSARSYHNSNIRKKSGCNKHASGRRAEQMAITISQRLYTFSGKCEPPHFVVSTVPSLRDRPNNIELTSDTEISSVQDSSSIKPKKFVLKARKPVVIPLSSAKSRSKAIFSSDTDINNMKALKSIEEKEEKEREILETQNQTNTQDIFNNSGPIPAIANSSVRRVRVVEPEKNSDTQMDDYDTLSEESDKFSNFYQKTSRYRSKLVSLSPTSTDPFNFINYLLSNPKSKEFVYMNPVKDSGKYGQATFNPYYLRIVDFGEVDKVGGYFTLSNMGVTHFDSRGHGEFTPLSQWLREYQLFHRLLKILFFSRYRIWKCFTWWRKSVLHGKIHSSRKSLTKQLFIAHPILRDALLAIRSKCAELLLTRKLVLLRIKEKTSYELSEFVQEQREWVEDVQCRILKKWEVEVRHIVEDAGIQCLKEKGFEVLNFEPQIEENDESMSISSVSKKSAPIQENVVSRKMTFTEQAARRSECRRLQRFVKLADYMIVNTLHMLAVESAQSLLSFVFRGCEDKDVVVDSQNGGQLIIDAMEDDIDSNVEIDSLLDSAYVAAISVLNQINETNSANGDMEMMGSIANGGIQVGGIVVGPEVGTSELVNCGFDGFPSILSKIAKRNIPKIELMEAVDEEGPSSNNAELEISEVSQIESLGSSERVKSKNQKEKEVLGKDEKKNLLVPLFKTELLLKQNSTNQPLYFLPSLSDLLQAFDIILKLFMSTIERFPLLTNTIDYLDPTKMANRVEASGDGAAVYSVVRGLEESEFGEGPSIGAIVIEGLYFREVCGRIRGVLVGMYTNCVIWMKSWENVREMWIENETFDYLKTLEINAGEIAVILVKNNQQTQYQSAVTSSGSSGSQEGVAAAVLLAYAIEKEKEQQNFSGEAEPEVKKDRSILQISSTIWNRSDGSFYSPLVEFFETSLSKFSMQKTIMHAIPVSSIVNNFLIDTLKLKNMLVPSPERCFRDVSKILPGLSRDKNELLLGEIQTWVRILNSPSQNVEGFVEYLGWLEKIKDTMNLVENFYDEITRLYNLMEAHKIVIQPTDLALYQTLGPSLRQIKEALDMATDTKEENISKFTSELDHSTSELMNEVSDIRNRAQDPMVLNPGAKSDLVISFLEELCNQLERIETLRVRYEMWAELFKSGGSVSGMQNKAEVETKAPPTAALKVGELEETKTEVELKRTLWTSLREWEIITESWRNMPFDSLNTEDINTQIATYLKIVYNLDKGLPPNDVVPNLKAMVDEYRQMYTTIVDLRNPALKARHWEKIQDAIGKGLVKDETFTLAKLIELRVFEFKEEIGNISSQAGSEAALEEMLGKVVKTWNDAEFIVINYRDNKDVFILGAIDDIQTMLEDSQVTIATIKSSRFIGPIRGEVEKWDKQLNLFSETLDAWMVCQRNWLYLESIFSAPDIQRQLPDEARMFSQVDRTWKDIMRKVYRNPNAMKSGTIPGLLETLQQNNVLLDQIQKCLEDYLESKRLLFPRFYFLSNEELLEILSQTRNPQAVQPHLSKCFDAIKSLEFSSSDTKNVDIVAMISPEGERVPFVKTIKARGNVEAWLGSVEEAMVGVLRRLLKSALSEYEEPKRCDWIREHVGQVVVTGNQVIWCRDITECLKVSDPPKALTAMKQKSNNKERKKRIAALVRGDLTKLQRAILGALITIDVHNRDIMTGLIEAKVKGLADFEWTKQMRYFWDMDSDSCHVKMSTSTFNYGYEYLGCSPRLVITPLTDRCYLTLTGAMQLNLGGSPVGPAGTGKTETVKDLAKALAKQCVVFNCSDGLDYKMMGKMFAGLAQSGAWCCFDEFNRIDIEVLSVIAQQLLSIKNAKDMKALKFMFEGREIRLIDTCCAFITMNPGYAGRTELP
ncbi:Dynein heavy chain 6, axonemal, partial [Nowakowskiella sp. JEL0078]